MALTATATPGTIIKIKNKLLLSTTNVIKSSFVKKQLHLDFIRKDDISYNINSIHNIIQKHKCKTIIYCKTKKETETICETLKRKGVLVEYYHGDLDTDQRTAVQTKFTNGEVEVMTATIAFGMGIDISNIYLIIHYGISKDIESYYQEIGRAGRDGHDSYCYLFWSENDFRLNKYFVKQISDPDLKKSQSNKIKQVENLVYSKQCRMKFILNYFGEEYDQCNQCDNCKKYYSPIILPNKIYIYTILKTFKELDHGIGITKLINILFGSRAKDISPNMKKISTYGIYNRNTDKKYIMSIIYELLENRLLTKQNLSELMGSFYNISSDGSSFYSKNKKIYENAIHILNKFGKLILTKCKKTKAKKTSKSVKKSKLPSSGKRWTDHEDNLISILLHNHTIEEIASQLGRSKKSLELRIIQNINKDKIHFSALSSCNFIPSSNKIKSIQKVVSSLDTPYKLKSVKDKLSKDYSYFDIHVALSIYGKSI